MNYIEIMSKMLKSDKIITMRTLLIEAVTMYFVKKINDNGSILRTITTINIRTIIKSNHDNNNYR